MSRWPSTRIPQLEWVVRHFTGTWTIGGEAIRNGSHGDPKKDIAYGYNVQEQWDYAIKQNTPFIYVTGWNEWIAGKFPSHDKNPEHSWFCDQASPEYSRDIEPSLTAGLKDHYYMQLVSNVRRYKGVEANPQLGPVKTIRKLDDLERGCIGLPGLHRRHAGTEPSGCLRIEPAHVYVNKTGRNDFEQLKAARDSKNLLFYAQTNPEITPNSGGDNWMRLYLSSDRKPTTGWKGFDYRIIGW